MTDDLVKKAARGVGWNISSQAVQQAIRFFVIIILTRLLGPEDFGMFAMVMVFTEFIRPFREWGFQAALIQKKDIDEECRSTAFWALCGVAAVLYILSCVSAPFVGHFFNSSLVGQIIPVSALAFLLSPFGAIQWALFTKELNFRATAIVDMVATLFYGLAACILALKGFGVWSFVLASLVRELAWSLLFWVICDWRPLFKFSFAMFKELMNFAGNCMGSGVFNYGINNFDNLIVGKFLGAIPLGFYNLAFNTVSQPQMRIVSQITSVVFPAYSMIKDEKERFQEVYLKTVKMVALVTVPLISVIFVATKDFVVVFYGPKWLAAVLPIKIMCLYGLFRALTSMASSVFLSQGKPDIELKLTMVRLLVFVGFIFYGIHYGIVGVALAVLAYSLVNFFPTLYMSNRLLGIGHLKFYAAIFKYIVFYIAVIATLCLAGLFYQRCGLNAALVRLMLSCIVAFSVYSAMLVIFARDDIAYLVKIAKKVAL